MAARVFLLHQAKNITTRDCKAIPATFMTTTQPRSPWTMATRKSSTNFYIEPPVDIQKEIVVVTGGSGFLGQHIVKHMMEQREFPVLEVRVFDIQPLKWFYGLEGSEVQVPLRQYQGDLCNKDDLQRACEGATVVIHNASTIDTTTNPDVEKLQRINVVGTENVIQTCLQHNVKYLLYTSSISAEDKLGAYGTSKRQAEDLIREANSKQVQNGQKLRTCALRAVAMFGEGDGPLVFNGLKKNISRNTFNRIGDDAPLFQTAYAGNIAWAFVTAIRQFRTLAAGTNIADPAGLAIGIADATPLHSYSRFMEPFVNRVGAKLSGFYVPYWFLLIIANAGEWLSYLLRPIYSLRLPLSKMAVISMYRLPIVHPDEANKYLGYKPLYSYEDVLPRCLQYYEYAYGLKKM